MLTRRPGMTLIEVLIALAILALIAAIVVPTTAGRLRQGHAAALANQLTNLRTAIANFRENVGAYPEDLSQLTTQPVAGADDACNVDLSNGELNAWRGPYINQNIIGPMPVGNATIQTELRRVAVTATMGALQIRAANVDGDIALDLEQQFDGNNDLTFGNVVWSAAGDDTLTFNIPIRGC